MSWSNFLGIGKKAISLVLIFSVALSPTFGYAQSVALPNPGQMIGVSSIFTPVILKGMIIHPDDPLKFDFLMDTGTNKTSGEDLRQEAQNSIKYFLASLTVPEDDLWVNLSPYEKDRVIPESFGKTAMGRDLLAEDYVLKQLASSLLYPEGGLGKQFWSQIYAEAAKAGVTDIDVSQFNRVWIVPSEAKVWEHDGKVVILNSRLKVMMESDYVAQKARGVIPSEGEALVEGSQNVAMPRLEEARHDAGFQDLSKQIMRQVILPVIEKEVNEGENFARLRQVYAAMVLSAWYKIRLKESLLGKAYADQNKVTGVEFTEGAGKEDIYNQYLASARKGVFNLIREEKDPVSGELQPRKYFSGGFIGKALGALVDGAMVTGDAAALTPDVRRAALSALSAPSIVRVAAGVSDVGFGASAAYLADAGKQGVTSQKVGLDAAMKVISVNARLRELGLSTEDLLKFKTGEWDVVEKVGKILEENGDVPEAVWLIKQLTVVPHQVPPGFQIKRRLVERLESIVDRHVFKGADPKLKKIPGLIKKLMKLYVEEAGWSSIEPVINELQKIVVDNGLDDFVLGEDVNAGGTADTAQTSRSGGIIKETLFTLAVIAGMYLLASHVRHERRETDQIIAEALAKPGSSAVPALQEMLKKGDERNGESYRAAIALGLIGDARAVPDLLEVLKANKIAFTSNYWTSFHGRPWFISDVAEEALVKIGQPAVPGLLELLNYKDDRSPTSAEIVRLRAITALGEIGDKTAVMGLTAAMKGKSEAERAAIAQALTAIGDKTSDKAQNVNVDAAMVGPKNTTIGEIRTIAGVLRDNLAQADLGPQGWNVWNLGDSWSMAVNKNWFKVQSLAWWLLADGLVAANIPQHLTARIGEVDGVISIIPLLRPADDNDAEGTVPNVTEKADLEALRRALLSVLDRLAALKDVPEASAAMIPIVVPHGRTLAVTGTNFDEEALTIVLRNINGRIIFNRRELKVGKPLMIAGQMGEAVVEAVNYGEGLIGLIEFKDPGTHEYSVENSSSEGPVLEFKDLPMDPIVWNYLVLTPEGDVRDISDFTKDTQGKIVSVSVFLDGKGVQTFAADAVKYYDAAMISFPGFAVLKPAWEAQKGKTPVVDVSLTSVGRWTVMLHDNDLPKPVDLAKYNRASVVEARQEKDFLFRVLGKENALFDGEVFGFPIRMIAPKGPTFDHHMLLLPNVEDGRPQLMRAGDIMAAMTLARVDRSGQWRFFHNSRGAGGMVNNMHIHALPIPAGKTLPVEEGKVDYFVQDQGSVNVGVVNNYPLPVIVFSGDSSRLAQVAGMFLKSLQEDNQPYNVLIAKDKVFVFPRGEEIVSLGVDDNKYYLGAIELSGFLETPGVGKTARFTEEGIAQALTESGVDAQTLEKLKGLAIKSADAAMNMGALWLRMVSVSDLVKKLVDGDETISVAAATELKRRGQSVVPGLLNALMGMGGQEDEEAVTKIGAVLDGFDVQSVAPAFEAMARKALKAGDKKNLKRLVVSLGGAGAESSVPVLTEVFAQGMGVSFDALRDPRLMEENMLAVSLFEETVHALATIGGIQTGRQRLYGMLKGRTQEEMMVIQEVLRKIDESRSAEDVVAEKRTDALVKAADTGDLGRVKAALSAGADINGISMPSGFSPLMAASMKGHKEIVAFLIQKGAAVNAVNGQSETALMSAAFGGYTEIVELLIANKADINAQDAQGVTALSRAASKLRKDVVALLLKKGADVRIKGVTGMTALMYLALNEYEEALILKQWNDSGSLTLALQDDKDGSAEPLYALAFRIGKEIAELLIAAGVDVNAQIRTGETALMIASRGGNKELVEFLLNKGADNTMKAHRGSTSLMEASTRGHLDIVNLLIARGAEVNAVMKEGRARTALAIARSKKYNEVVNALLAAGAKDSAMSDAAMGRNLGGIDLDVKKLDLQIQRDGDGVALPVDQQDWSKINIQGFIPVIYSIEPVNMPMLLGLDVSDRPSVGSVPVGEIGDLPVGKELDPVGA